MANKDKGQIKVLLVLVCISSVIIWNRNDVLEQWNRIEGLVFGWMIVLVNKPALVRFNTRTMVRMSLIECMMNCSDGSLSLL